MGLDPAMGGEVHGDAGGKQEERDGQCAGDPSEVDAVLEDEEVEDAEDENEHRCFGEERGATPGGDEGQIEQRVGLAGGWLAEGIGAAGSNQAEACGVRGGVWG